MCVFHHVISCNARFATVSDALFQAPKLPVRENDAGQVFVANLTSLPVASFAEFDKIYTYVILIPLLCA